MPRRAFVALLILSLCAVARAQTPLPTILLVGYLPPSNEMLRQFSANPAQNPGIWIGENWEQRAFTIRAFFPEFPLGAQCMGVGDFEIDYQDTANDLARLTQQFHPVAILTFSLGSSAIGWGFEPAYQRWRLPGELSPPGGHNVPYYFPDCTGQRYPSNPAVLADPVGHVRFSNLPMQDLVSAIAAQLPHSSVAPFIYPYDPRSASSSSFGGNYLSGYIGYLAALHREHNQPPASPTPCYLTGHVHVGHYVTPASATLATEIMLREVISTLRSMSNSVQITGGACCGADGDSCMFSVGAGCSGLFMGPGTACTPGICPPVPIGSCCLIDGSCTPTVHSECDYGPRLWTAGASCAPNPCAPGVPGTCCRGATCNPAVGPAQCTTSGVAAGAFFSTAGSSCAPAPGLPAPCCHADYNKSGSINASDIFDYLRDWLDATEFAIIDGDGSAGRPDVEDLFGFLNGWFAGCQ